MVRVVLEGDGKIFFLAISAGSANMPITGSKAPSVARCHAEECRIRDHLHGGRSSYRPLRQIRTEEFGAAGAELPPGASVGVNAFAWHDMLLEIAAAAAVDKRARRSNSDQRARSFLYDDAP